jgi:7-cyano-7-deazaguanine synthase
MKKRSVCILVSGGLDSAVLTHYLARQFNSVYPVYVQSGLAWEKVELKALRMFLSAASNERVMPLTVLSMPMADVYASHWSVTGKEVPDEHSADERMEIPGRNVVLLAKASVFCAVNGINSIAMGSLGGNPFPDATPSFFKGIAKMLGQGLGFPLTIIAPFRKLSKEQVIHLGKNLPLEKTMSCVQPMGLAHCGRCNKCAERKSAFIKAGVRDKTRYLAQA